MDATDLIFNSFFTSNGKDIWKLESYYQGPSCTLRNLETGETRNFGMGGLMAKDFHRIKMPINCEKQV